MAKKILVIDDDLSILEVIKIILEEKGYLVITIFDNRGLDKKILTIKPDLILLDFLMTGINGGEITKLLKNQEETKNIPIVMISANHDIQYLKKQFATDDFLAKPFDIDDLTEIVGKNLDKNKNYST